MNGEEKARYEIMGRETKEQAERKSEWNREETKSRGNKIRGKEKRKGGGKSR